MCIQYGQAIQILTANGHGKFTLRSSFAVATPPIASAAADLNGDGIPDIAAADEAMNNLHSNVVTVLESSPHGEGKPDIVVTDGQIPGDVHVLLQK